MPTEHVSCSFAFAELDETAQDKAVDAVAGKLTGEWWDSSDDESVGQTINLAFADVLGTPDADKYGQGDFPGIDGVSLVSWSCSYAQGDHVGFAGSLTRDNAPKLPWVAGIDSVTLESRRDFTSVWYVMDEAECICDPFAGQEPTCEAHTPNPATESQIQAMRDAVESALSTALQAGYKEIEYIGSAENAREWIESNEPQFDEDGSLFS